MNFCQIVVEIIQNYMVLDVIKKQRNFNVGTPLSFLEGKKERI